MTNETETPQAACFVISVAARLLKVHPQTLRYYERAGLIAPSRSKGNIRLYSVEDIQRAMQIKRLIEDLGVNLAGVEVIMRLTDRLREQEEQLVELRGRLDEYQEEMRRLRAR
jgi:MerR family transcriptional regulator/heat shock protein HspR